MGENNNEKILIPSDNKLSTGLLFLIAIFGLPLILIVLSFLLALAPFILGGLIVVKLFQFLTTIYVEMLEHLRKRRINKMKYKLKIGYYEKV